MGYYCGAKSSSSTVYPFQHHIGPRAILLGCLYPDQAHVLYSMFSFSSFLVNRCIICLEYDISF